MFHVLRRSRQFEHAGFTANPSVGARARAHTSCWRLTSQVHMASDRGLRMLHRFCWLQCRSPQQIWI